MIKQKPLPEIRLLREIFVYRDGFLYWNKSTGKCPHEGKKDGTINVRGYYRIGYKRKNYAGHRIIYALHHGFDPGIMYVDHIDGDTRNNKIENLQLVTAQENTHKSRAVNNNPKQIHGTLTEYGKECMRQRNHDNRNRLHLSV
jgi:hypothetical protein